MRDNSTLVEVYSPANMVQVTLLTQLLEDAGVEFRVVNDKLHGAVGDIPFTKTDPQIWVRSEDLSTAATICQEFDQQIVKSSHNAVATAGTLFCYHCGETLNEEGDFCPACSCRLTDDSDDQVQP